MKNVTYFRPTNQPPKIQYITIFMYIVQNCTEQKHDVYTNVEISWLFLKKRGKKKRKQKVKCKTLIYDCGFT